MGFCVRRRIEKGHFMNPTHHQEACNRDWESSANREMQRSDEATASEGTYRMPLSSRSRQAGALHISHPYTHTDKGLKLLPCVACIGTRPGLECQERGAQATKPGPQYTMRHLPESRTRRGSSSSWCSAGCAAGLRRSSSSSLCPVGVGWLQR